MALEPTAPGYRTRAVPYDLKIGWYIYWHRDDYRVVPNPERVDARHVTLEDLTTFPRKQLTVLIADIIDDPDDDANLVIAPTLKELHALVKKSFQPKPVAGKALRENMLRRADDLITSIETIQALVAKAERDARDEGTPFRLIGLKDAPRTGALEKACDSIGICVKTYYNRHALYTKYKGRRDEIAASSRRCTFGQTKMTPAQQHIVDTILLRHTRAEPSILYQALKDLLILTRGKWVDTTACAHVPMGLIDDLYDERIPMEAIEANSDYDGLLIPITLPRKTWFYGHVRYVQALPDIGKAYVDGRYGEGTWDRHYLVFDSLLPYVSRPLQYVFADHALLPIAIVDEETRSERRRLWLTLFIDAYSRSIIGMALLYENPCIESIQTGLSHAIWPKKSHRDLGLEDDWAPWGSMGALFLDNAWAHHSKSLERLCSAISQGDDYPRIELHFRQPYMARKGALIERLIGNVKVQVRAHLAGAMRSRNPNDVHDAMQDACFLYDDIYQFIHELILRYQHTIHGELNGLTPHQKWMQGIQETGQPMAPKKTPDMERLFWRLHHEPRVIGERGIELFGLDYSSDAVKMARKRTHQGNSIKYYVRYKPENITTVAVFREDEYIGEAKARKFRLPDGEYGPMSKAAWELTKKRTRLKGQTSDGNGVLLSLEAWKMRHMQRKEEKKAIQKQLASPPLVTGRQRRTKGATVADGGNVIQLPANDNMPELDALLGGRGRPAIN